MPFEVDSIFLCFSRSYDVEHKDRVKNNKYISFHIKLTIEDWIKIFYKTIYISYTTQTNHYTEQLFTKHVTQVDVPILKVFKCARSAALWSQKKKEKT